MPPCYLRFGVFAIVVLASTASFVCADQRSVDRRAEGEATERFIFTTVCGLNNIVKANNRWQVFSAKTAFGSSAVHRKAVTRANELFPILDCEQTFNTRNDGRAVVLPNTQQERYIALIGRGRIPLVKDRRVVGSRRPESGRLADF